MLQYLRGSDGILGHFGVCLDAGTPEADKVEHYGRAMTDLGKFAESCLRDNRNTRGTIKS
jgi:hypothetical protein